MNATTSLVKPTVGYSYLRFSKSSQQFNESLKRQRKSTADFCKANGITLVEEMQALGVSAFRGKNLEDTEILGIFLKRIKEGKIPSDGSACLIVESFDRISRDKVLRAQQVLIDIICNGVGIAPLSFNGQILTEDSIGKQPTLLVMAIVEQMRGNNESQLKSERVMDNFNKKYGRIAEGEKVYMGGHMPSWISGLKNGKWLVDESRVAIVKRIFKEFAAGSSLNKIAVGLNEDAKQGKVPGCMRAKRSTKRQFWERATIRCILTNPTVTGVFTLKGKENPNYLPVVITRQDFDIVQSKVKQNAGRRGGSSNGDVNFIFRGNICKCKCGGSIGIMSQHDTATRHYTYLGCTNTRKGTCDANLKFRMDLFERAFFGHCLHYAPSDFLANEAKLAVKELESKQAELVAITKKINQVVAIMDSGIDLGEIKERLASLQSQRKTITEGIKDLNTKTNAATVIPAAAKSFTRLVHDDLEDQAVRKELVNILPVLVKSITFRLKEYKDFDVEFHNGEKWSYTGSIEEFAIDTKGKLHALEQKRSNFEL